MRTNRFAIFTTLLLLGALALAVTAAAADQHSGTWKMNPAKSKYSPGPAPKSTTVKVEADEKAVEIDAKIVNADGSPTHVEYDAKFDGKDYPVTGLPNADTVSVKRIEEGRPGDDDRDYEGLQRRKNTHFDFQGQGRGGTRSPQRRGLRQTVRLLV